MKNELQNYACIHLYSCKITSLKTFIEMWKQTSQSYSATNDILYIGERGQSCDKHSMCQIKKLFSVYYKLATIPMV